MQGASVARSGLGAVIIRPPLSGPAARQGSLRAVSAAMQKNLEGSASGFAGDRQRELRALGDLAGAELGLRRLLGQTRHQDDAVVRHARESNHAVEDIGPFQSCKCTKAEKYLFTVTYGKGSGPPPAGSRSWSAARAARELAHVLVETPVDDAKETAS